jgi:hypothetical protein
MLTNPFSFNTFKSAGNDVNTVLLIHSDTTDASTTFTDSSASAHTVTANANVQHDTAQKKFGATSILFDGTGDFLSISDHSDFSFGTGSFTFDFWVRVATLEDAVLWKQYDASSNKCFIELTSTGRVKVNLEVSGSAVFGSYTNTDISTNTWYHIAIVRNSAIADPTDQILMFIGGVESTDTVENALVAAENWCDSFTTDLKFGGEAVESRVDLDGWLDEIRISNVARWTANFTPPTVAYS